MKVQSKIVVILTILLFMSGCVVTPRLSTPSGRPEVTIYSTDIAKIRALVINNLMNEGYSVVSDTNYNIVLSKPMDDFGGIMYRALLGNSYYTPPVWNIRISMVTINDHTRVMAQAVVKMQNAYGREETNDMTNGKSGAGLQRILERVKDQTDEPVTRRVDKVPYTNVDNSGIQLLYNSSIPLVQ